MRWPGNPPAWLTFWKMRPDIRPIAGRAPSSASAGLRQMSWQRFGALPAWAGKGKAIYHLVSWRVESEKEFPAPLLAWARESMSLWLKPPADVAEVRRLQKGDAGEAWAK